MNIVEIRVRNGTKIISLQSSCRNKMFWKVTLSLVFAVR